MNEPGDVIKKVVASPTLRKQTVFREDDGAPDVVPPMEQIATALAERREIHRQQIRSLKECLQRAEEILNSMDA